MSAMAEIGSARNSSTSVQQKGGTAQKSSQRQVVISNQSGQLTNNNNINNQGMQSNSKSQAMQNVNPNSIRISLLKDGGYSSTDMFESNRNKNNANLALDSGNSSSKSNSNSSRNSKQAYKYGMNFNAILGRQYDHPSQRADSPASDSDSRLKLLRLVYKKKLHTRLYEKFSQSQNYYYIRDVSDLLAGIRTSFTIQHKDQQTMDEQNEYLKRIYHLREYPGKIKLLTEYYKFHSDIPRLFMQPSAPLMEHMHIKKRRIEFYRIAKLFEEENKKNPTKPPKGIVGDVPAPGTEESVIGKKEKQAGKKLDKGLSCFLEDISSFVNNGEGDSGIAGKGDNKVDKGKKNAGGEDNKNRSGSMATAERLNKERKQLMELKEKQLIKSKQQQQQQQQQQGDESIIDNNNNDESSLSVMNSRLRDILQVSSMSQTSMKSEATIQDISENHGLDDFLMFLRQQSANKGGSQVVKSGPPQQQRNTKTNENNRMFNEVTDEQEGQKLQAAQLALLSPESISINQQKLSSPQSQQEQQQQVKYQREQQQQQQQNVHTKTIVASLYQDPIQQQPQFLSQKGQENKNNNQAIIDPDRQSSEQQQQSSQQQTQRQLIYPQQTALQKQDNNLSSPNTARNAINAYPQLAQRSGYSMQLQTQQQQQEYQQAADGQPQEQLKSQFTSSSSQQQIANPKTAKLTSNSLLNGQQSARSTHINGGNVNDLVRSQPGPFDLKSNLNSIDQTAVTRSATTSLKNSFGMNNNNNSKTSSLSNANTKISNDNNNNNNNLQNASNSAVSNNERQQQQPMKRGDTASGLHVRIFQSMPINQGVDSYPLTARTQSNRGNTSNAPQNELARQAESTQPQNMQQQPVIISNSSPQHSRHVSISNQLNAAPPIGVDLQQQYQQKQLQQQYPSILLSSIPNNSNCLASPTNASVSPVATPAALDLIRASPSATLSAKTNSSSPSTGNLGNNQFSQQYQQQQFKISKLKKNSINSLHTFSSTQQQPFSSPRAAEGQEQDIDEYNKNQQQQQSRQQSGNSSSKTSEQGYKQGIILISQQQKHSASIQSSHSTRSNTQTKAGSQVNSPINVNFTNSNKQSLELNQNGQVSSNISGGTSTLSSFKHLHIKNSNENNSIASPQVSQHTIQLKQTSTAPKQQQQQQQQPQQQQQFSSYLRTASTGFTGNLLLQPSQSVYTSNHPSNTPSGSISARNQLPIAATTPAAASTTTNSMHQRQHSNPTTAGAALTKNSLQSLHRFNQSSSNNLNAAKINSDNIYSPHNQDYFQSANASPVPPPSLTLHSNSNVGSPRSMDTTKPSFFGSTTRTRPSLQSHQQLQVFIQEPQQQQQQQQQQQGQQTNKQTSHQNSHKYTKSEAQGMLTQSHPFFQAQEYTNTPPSSLAFSALSLNSAQSLTSLTERSKLQSRQSKQLSMPQQQQKQQQQQSSSSNAAMTKLGPVKQAISTKQQLSQHTSHGINQQQTNQLGIPNYHSQQTLQQQPYQLSNSIHSKQLSPRQQIAFPLTRA